MQSTVLYTSRDIHTKIKRLLAAPESDEIRIVIAPYVGQDAAAFLPDPHELTLICTLAARGTSAKVLKDFLDRGARVLAAPGIHMKVYWSSKRGCVICSANVSSNALAANGLKEAGVFLPAGEVDIERFRQEFTAAPVTIPQLADLKRRNDKAASRRDSGEHDESEIKPARHVSFTEWAAHYSEIDPWTLGWWEGGELPASDGANSTALTSFGHRPVNWLNTATAEVEAAWVLTFEGNQGTDPDWLYVDFVVPVAPEDHAYEREAPYQMVQATAQTPDSPFEIDQPFSRALAHVVQELGPDRTKGMKGMPPTDFLARLLASYKSFA